VTQRDNPLIRKLSARDGLAKDDDPQGSQQTIWPQSAVAAQYRGVVPAMRLGGHVESNIINLFIIAQAEKQASRLSALHQIQMSRF